MRSFVLLDIRLLSRREQAATHLVFHPKATVIRGENDMGKSSVLKSIYWTFGAAPAKTSDPWEGIDLVSAVRFVLEGQTFTLLRHGDDFAIFDQDDRVFHVAHGTTKGVGPFLARLFGFGLLLNDRNGVPQIPPPAYYLLPYYIDQDEGWTEPWTSFAGLQQFTKWKSDVAEYHIGLRDHHYYELKTSMMAAKAEMDEPRLEESALTRAIEQVRLRVPIVPVDFDLDRYQREVAELVAAAAGLADEEEGHRQTVGALSNERVFVEQQIRLAEHVIRELRDDYDYTINQPDDVECPTCGAMYHNSVLERFGLALSEFDCADILVSLRRRLGELEQAISASTLTLKGARDRHQALWDLLNSKRDALTLHEILKGEARGQAIDVLATEVSRVRDNLDRLSRRVESAKDEMKSYETRGRRKEFLDRLSGRLTQHCVLLNVPAPPALRSFVYTPHETGSDVPRAVLAHNYAVLSMAWESRNPIHAPVIVDSPNQKDQDPVNLRLMLEFIRARTAKDSQLIVGLVDPQGVDFGGSVIELTAKRSVLSRERYADVGLRLEDLVSQMSLALANQ